MHSAKTFEKKWSRLLEASGAKTDSALAKALDILPQSVTAARRRGQIPGGWIEKVAEQFAVNANWLLFGTGAMRELGSDFAAQPGTAANCKNFGVPVIGLAACGLAGWYNPGPLAIRMPLPLGQQTENLFAVFAVGTSMQPEGIRQGYVLFCDPTLLPEPGDAVYIEKTDGTASVKQFKGRDDVWVHLQGWLEPDMHGVQKHYTERVAQDTVSALACVVFVKRKA